MNWYFLSDESEKSLAPFFSKHVLESVMAGVAIVGIFSVVLWSRRPLAEYFVAGQGPKIFFLVFAATLIVYSYINLCCGGGELVRRGYHMINYPTDQPTHEMEIAFFRYGMIEFVLHTIAMLLPFLPLLFLAALGSAVSTAIFAMAVSILFSASLFSRLTGFLIYLLWGRFSTLGYFIARLTMIVFVFATLFIVPAVNPLRLLYQLNHNPDGIGFGYAIYMAAVSVAILVLILLSNALVNRHLKRKNELK